MTAAVQPREMSYSEFLTLPEDCRAELLDGVVDVNAMPAYAHQRACQRLMTLLEGVLAPGLAVVLSFGWHIDDSWEPGPDLMVVEDRDHGRRFEGVPRLVVEVPSRDRRTDLDTKRLGYALGRAPYYWVVDLAVPSVTVLELRGGAYDDLLVLRGHERGDLPYEGGTLSLAPVDLLDPWAR